MRVKFQLVARAALAPRPGQGLNAQKMAARLRSHRVGLPMARASPTLKPIRFSDSIAP